MVSPLRWEAVPQPRVWPNEDDEEDRAKQKRSSGDFFDRKKTTCMLYLQVGLDEVHNVENAKKKGI